MGEVAEERRAAARRQRLGERGRGRDAGAPLSSPAAAAPRPRTSRRSARKTDVRQLRFNVLYRLHPAGRRREDGRVTNRRAVVPKCRPSKHSGYGVRQQHPFASAGRDVGQRQGDGEDDGHGRPRRAGGERDERRREEDDLCVASNRSRRRRAGIDAAGCGDAARESFAGATSVSFPRGAATVGKASPGMDSPRRCTITSGSMTSCINLPMLFARMRTIEHSSKSLLPSIAAAIVSDGVRRHPPHSFEYCTE